MICFLFDNKFGLIKRLKLLFKEYKTFYLTFIRVRSFNITIIKTTTAIEPTTITIIAIVLRGSNRVTLALESILPLSLTSKT